MIFFKLKVKISFVSKYKDYFADSKKMNKPVIIMIELLSKKKYVTRRPENRAGEKGL